MSARNGSHDNGTGAENDDMHDVNDTLTKVRQSVYVLTYHDRAVIESLVYNDNNSRRVYT